MSIKDRDSQIDQNMLVPPNMNNQNASVSPAGSSTGSGRRHRRLSSLNTVSWPNQNELTVSPRPRRMSTVPSSDPLEDPQVINKFRNCQCGCVKNFSFLCE